MLRNVVRNGRRNAMSLDMSGNGFAPLGFGFMRLPEVGADDAKTFDHEQICAMVDEFMAAGFTYFDTAYGYHNGKSECELKAALVDRYPRESYQVATKLPAWLAKDAAQARAMFDESLEKTGLEYFDYYLLHNLAPDLSAKFDEYDLWSFVEEKREAGLIKHLGFSIHDNAEALEAVLQKHPNMDFVQAQINYADWESESIQARKCYEVARAHNLPVIVMEPVKGGSLVKLPEQALDILRAQDAQATPASWALRFAASLPGVFMVLSGMSTLDQVQDNVRTMAAAAPLTEVEQAAVSRVREVLDGMDTIPCTNCRYCLETCAEGIAIPVYLESLNIMTMYEDMHRAQENVIWNAGGVAASECIECGACEAVCPQHINITQRMKRAAELFG